MPPKRQSSGILLDALQLALQNSDGSCYESASSWSESVDGGACEDMWSVHDGVSEITVLELRRTLALTEQRLLTLEQDLAEREQVLAIKAKQLEQEKKQRKTLAKNMEQLVKSSCLRVAQLEKENRELKEADLRAKRDGEHPAATRCVQKKQIRSKEASEPERAASNGRRNSQPKELTRCPQTFVSLVGSDEEIDPQRRFSVCGMYEEGFSNATQAVCTSPASSSAGSSASIEPKSTEEDAEEIEKLLASVAPTVRASIKNKFDCASSEIEFLRSMVASYEDVCSSGMPEGRKTQMPPRGSRESLIQRKKVCSDWLSDTGKVLGNAGAYCSCPLNGSCSANGTAAKVDCGTRVDSDSEAPRRASHTPSGWQILNSSAS